MSLIYLRIKVNAFIGIPPKNYVIHLNFIKKDDKFLLKNSNFKIILKIPC